MTHAAISVDVVIPYYRDQAMLDRILAALRHQTGLDGRASGGAAHTAPGAACAVRVIVADDGSPTPPVVPPEVTVVTQDDRGFRASAARHLGACAGDGDLLLFLDGDTVPGPGYVAAICAALEGDPDLLVVGRRRYGRFAPTTPGAEPGIEPVEILPDPAWPASFYDETADLTRGDDLWRGVLSAACGLHRRLYELAGGFDPDIVGYGGEDWDLAWRCEQAGGRLRHLPDAVAWHDGPDWAGRADARQLAQKNAESALLAGLIASPLTRPAGGIFGLPSIAVHIHAGSPEFAGTGSAAATCISLLSWADVAVTVDPATSDAAVIAELFAADPRVTLGPRGPWWRPGTSGQGPRRRPPVLVDILRPCALGELDARRLRALCPPMGSVGLDDDEGYRLAEIRSSRALAREQEWGDHPPETTAIAASHGGVRVVDEDGTGVRLERVLGGW
ncbi:glycosyltransferase family 2 protein [Dietzia sp. B32]|uniref:glycosyltransferase family 2 protein n=1 Tax=Dietzia sp. B32 TaxID=2915130 RepID=UPI0021AD8437|nr:glycosyltransferase family 2 protein [Dietzia sp. B32]UVE93867.1 glycosyltransferase [Dietzia sp. B32]